MTQQLRESQQGGLVKRFAYTQAPPKVEYYLTDGGKTSLCVLEALCQWGMKWTNQAGLMKHRR